MTHSKYNTDIVVLLTNLVRGVDGLAAPEAVVVDVVGVALKHGDPGVGAVALDEGPAPQLISRPAES